MERLERMRRHANELQAEFLMAQIAAALECQRFTVSSEAELQRGILSIFQTRFPGAFVRERHLSSTCRPDFWFPSEGIAVEVKWQRSGGSADKVLTQLARYAELEAVRGVILATPSRRVAAGVPDELLGVPIRTVILTTGL